MPQSFLYIKYLKIYQTNQISQQLKQILKCSGALDKMLHFVKYFMKFM